MEEMKLMVLENLILFSRVYGETWDFQQLYHSRELPSRWCRQFNEFLIFATKNMWQIKLIKYPCFSE